MYEICTSTLVSLFVCAVQFSFPEVGKMAFMFRRCLSTSARMFNQGACKFVVAIPAPLSHAPALETAELQQLARKAQGSWKEISNEEVVQLYRAQFPYTYREMISELHADYKTVIPAVLLLIAFSVWGADFLRKTVGPELPHTYNNPEWEAATREKLLKDRSNPIEGISSTV